MLGGNLLTNRSGLDKASDQNRLHWKGDIWTFELERGKGISHTDTWEHKLFRQWEQPTKKPEDRKLLGICEEQQGSQCGLEQSDQGRYVMEQVTEWAMHAMERFIGYYKDSGFYWVKWGRKIWPDLYFKRMMTLAAILKKSRGARMGTGRQIRSLLIWVVEYC